MDNRIHKLVIIGGGFGGLYTAKELGKMNIEVTLLDRRNFHLFQPLLYQLATGGLSPGDIASPLRAVLHRQKNTKVFKSEVIDIDTDNREVILRYTRIPYDTLVVATGSSHHYFGNDNWAVHAPGLKTVEDALEFRKRIFFAYECAEKETNPVQQRIWMTFVVVGGGPTGVELAGALGELANTTLKDDFRNINTRDSEIILLEGTDRILPTYPPPLSEKASQSLQMLGVRINTGTFATNITQDNVTVQMGNMTKKINSRTVLWAAGVRASKMGRILSERTGVKYVEDDLTIKGHPEIFVIGDLANFSHQNGEPLPGVAPVAMQEGKYVADTIKKRIKGEESKPFKYTDKGSLAVIGRNKAVAHIGKFQFSGFFAWLIWILIHIRYLIEYDNKILVLMQWSWNYFTKKRGSRLVTGTDYMELLQNEEEDLKNKNGLKSA